jgi:hypothetical protein
MWHLKVKVLLMLLTPQPGEIAISSGFLLNGEHSFEMQRRDVVQEEKDMCDSWGGKPTNLWLMKPTARAKRSSGWL